MKAFPASVALALLSALPAVAQDMADCVATRLDQGSRPGACVAEGLSACDAEPAETPAVAVLCYNTAQDTWGEGIATRMAEIRDSAPEKLSAVAGIEVKYDLLGNLMQCDRMEELSLVGEGEAATIQRDKARCTAAATGLVYVRLLMQAQDL